MPEYQRVEKNVKFAKRNFFDFVSFRSGLNFLICAVHVEVSVYKMACHFIVILSPLFIPNFSLCHYQSQCFLNKNETIFLLIKAHLRRNVIALATQMVAE